MLGVLARGVLGLLTRTFDFRTGAHDEGETKEIEEVKHRIFHSQKVEEAEFVLHATKEMKLWLATLHKHEDNERKENALMTACKEKSLYAEESKIIPMLLSAGFDLNQVDCHGENLLM